MTPDVMYAPIPDTTREQRIICLRHGACEGESILRGRTNVSLSDHGRHQIKQRAHLLPKPDIIFSSPLKRCLESATMLSMQWDVPLEVINDLAEMDFGEWDGVPLADINAAVPEKLSAFWTDPEHVTPPGGEPLHLFRQRINQVWERITDHPATRILVVTHGGVIKLWMAKCLGVMPLSADFLSALKLDYAQTALFRVSHDFRFTPAQWTVIEGFGSLYDFSHCITNDDSR